jgi:hypothetical protein
MRGLGFALMISGCALTALLILTLPLLAPISISVIILSAALYTGGVFVAQEHPRITEELEDEKEESSLSCGEDS